MLGDNQHKTLHPAQLKYELNKLSEKFSASITPCGSRVTCNPPPLDTDDDYLVLIPRGSELAASVVDHLSQEGWGWEGSEHYQGALADGFMSWRRGEVNLIVTSSEAFHRRRLRATAVCAKLNLMKKQDRIVLFQAILYDNVGGAIAKPKPDEELIP